MSEQTSTYTVRGCAIEHNGKRTPEGASIELDAATAKKLERWLVPTETKQKDKK